MRWNSFRVRLTLWNVAVLALVLGGFGLALCCSIQTWMSRSIDRQLAERAHRGFRPHPMFGGAPGYSGSRFDPFHSPRTFPGLAPSDRRVVLPFPESGPGSAGGAERRPETRTAGGGSGDRQGLPLLAATREGALRGQGPLSGPSGRHLDGLPMTAGERSFQGWPFDAEAERRAAFLRPRFLNLQGQVWGPPSARSPWDPHTVADAIAGRERYSTISVAGEPIRVLSAPLYDQGQIVGAIQVAHDMAEYDRLWHGEVTTLLALFPLSLLVAGIGGLFLTERALRPVHQVTHAAAQIGVEDLSRRLEVSGRDELAELAETFNGMIARLEAAFEQQRRFTADASHELRTPLARIKVTTSMALADDQSLDEYQTALRIADQAADAMDRLIQQLLLLARADSGQLPIERSRLNLGGVLQEAVAAVAQAGCTPVTLDLPPQPILIEGDADHLCRVFVNLLENSLRHTPAEGQITLSPRVVGRTALVRVIDTGEGIPPEHLPHVGERFYRVDAARTRRTGGCGLGLAISQTILQAHGGHLSIESEVGRGTVVTVSLPLSRDQASG
jgi:two-component system, OmpR family, sensor kinase